MMPLSRSVMGLVIALSTLVVWVLVMLWVGCRVADAGDVLAMLLSGCAP